MRPRVSREVSLTGQAQLLEPHPSSFACLGLVQGQSPALEVSVGQHSHGLTNKATPLTQCSCCLYTVSGDCPSLGDTFQVPAFHLTKQTAQDIPNCFQQCPHTTAEHKPPIPHRPK